VQIFLIIAWRVLPKSIHLPVGCNLSLNSVFKISRAWYDSMWFSKPIILRYQVEL